VIACGFDLWLGHNKGCKKYGIWCFSTKHAAIQLIELNSVVNGLRVMVFNATFNNISVVVVSFVGGGNRSTKRKRRYWQTLTHYVIVVSSTPRLSGIQTHNIVVNGDRYKV
jgi:hypothetical protein